MQLLSKRIAAISSQQSNAVELPILVLDAMLPRQRLCISMDDDAGLRMLNDALERHDGELGVHGMDPSTGGVLPVGTQVKIVEHSGRNICIVGQRRYDLVARPTLHDDTYYTCEISWCERDEGSASDVAAARELEALVDQWLELVRKGGFEREPNQMDEVLKDLGPRPSPEDPDEFAFWVAALVNPLPALGVAFEIRPFVLKAESAEERLQIVRRGLETSIGHLDGSSPLW